MAKIDIKVDVWEYIAVLPRRLFLHRQTNKKMADTRKRLVFRALRIVLRWSRDVARIYLIHRKAMIDSFTLVSGQKA